MAKDTGGQSIRGLVSEAQAAAARLRAAKERQAAASNDAENNSANNDADSAQHNLDAANGELVGRTGQSVTLDGVLETGWAREMIVKGRSELQVSDSVAARLGQGGIEATADLSDEEVMDRQARIREADRQKQLDDIVRRETGRDPDDLSPEQVRRALRNAALKEADGTGVLDDRPIFGYDPLEDDDEEVGADVDEMAYRMSVAAFMGKPLTEVTSADITSYASYVHDKALEGEVGKPIGEMSSLERMQAQGRINERIAEAHRTAGKKAEDAESSTGGGAGSDGDRADAAAGTPEEATDIAAGQPGMRLDGISQGSQGSQGGGAAGSATPPDDQAPTSGVPAGSKAYRWDTVSMGVDEAGNPTSQGISNQTVYRTPDGRWIDANGQPLPDDDAAALEDGYREVGDGDRNGNRDPSKDVPAAPPAGEQEPDDQATGDGSGDDDTSDDDTSDDDDNSGDEDSTGTDDTTENTDDGNGDDGAADDNTDGEGAKGGDSTPNPEGNFTDWEGTVAFWETPLGKAEGDRQRDALDQRKGGGYTDPSDEGGEGASTAGGMVTTGGDVDPYDELEVVMPSIDMLDVIAATGGGTMGPLEGGGEPGFPVIDNPILGGPKPGFGGGGLKSRAGLFSATADPEDPDGDGTVGAGAADDTMSDVGAGDGGRFGGAFDLIDTGHLSLGLHLSAGADLQIDTDALDLGE